MISSITLLSIIYFSPKYHNFSLCIFLQNYYERHDSFLNCTDIHTSQGFPPTSWGKGKKLPALLSAAASQLAVLLMWRNDC